MASANGDSRRVVIEVRDGEPDVLERIALLNTAFLRIVTGTRLVEVLEADYQEGRMEFVVEDGRVRPRVAGRVSVRYSPAH